MLDQTREADVGCPSRPARTLRIRGEIATSILLFVPSHGLISLLPWEPTASVADLETAAVNSPRILKAHRARRTKRRPRPPLVARRPDAAAPERPSRLPCGA